MQTVITVLHVVGALLLIVVVLLQPGKGSAIGAGLGGGSSQTMLGGGAGNFLTKLTAGIAILFMVTSLALATLSNKKGSRSVIQETEEPAVSQESPVESSSP